MVIDNEQLNKWATSKTVDLKQSSDYMEAIQWGLRSLLMIALTLTSVLIASIFYGLPHPAAHMKAPYYLQTLWSIRNRIFSVQIGIILLIVSETFSRVIGSSLLSWLGN